MKGSDLPADTIRLDLGDGNERIVPAPPPAAPPPAAPPAAPPVARRKGDAA